MLYHTIVHQKHHSINGTIHIHTHKRAQVKAHQVSPGQWISADARVMAERFMMQGGCQVTTAEGLLCCTQPKSMKRHANISGCQCRPTTLNTRHNKRLHFSTGGVVAFLSWTLLRVTWYVHKHLYNVQVHCVGWEDCACDRFQWPCHEGSRTPSSEGHWGSDSQHLSTVILQRDSNTGQTAQRSYQGNSSRFLWCNAFFCQFRWWSFLWKKKKKKLVS